MHVTNGAISLVSRESRAQAMHIFRFGTMRIHSSGLDGTLCGSENNSLCLCLQAFAFASLLGSHHYDEQSP